MAAPSPSPVFGLLGNVLGITPTAFQAETCQAQEEWLEDLTRVQLREELFIRLTTPTTFRNALLSEKELQGLHDVFHARCIQKLGVKCKSKASFIVGVSI
jgi:hypothetical protein